jgi:hypothetical protein
MSNGMTPQGTPMQTMASRPSLPGNMSGSLPNVNNVNNVNNATPLQRSTPKPKPTPKPNTPGSNLPAPPLDDVHAAFVEFRAKEEDKCLSVQCIYCNQIRAKNTSRQRQHLLECVTYQNVIKESIPANNLLHRFEENDIARSLSIPAPTLELDFRMSVKLNPKIPVGAGMFGNRNWISFIGGQWAGRWGKGIVIVSNPSNPLSSRLLISPLARRPRRPAHRQRPRHARRCQIPPANRRRPARLHHRALRRLAHRPTRRAREAAGPDCR